MQDDQHATPGPPGVDLNQSRRFLDLLDPRGVFTFQTFADREQLRRTFTGHDGKPRQFDPLAKVFHGTLDQYAPALIELNKQGAGVFAMINEGDGVVQKGRKTCRTNGNVIRIRANWIDLDGAPIDPVLAAPLRPDIVVESSPSKWHAYWRTDCPVEQFEAVQLALAAHFGGDPSVADLARVMRLPGFYHNKTTKPAMTRLLRPEPEAVQ